MRARAKVCCIASVEQARIAIQHGADAVGLVSEMPSGPGVISERLIAQIAATIPPGIATFLLTSKTSASEIIAQWRRCHVDTLQLVDRVSVENLRTLRSELPGVSLVQVVHVQDASSIDDAVGAAPHVDAVLLDSGNPGLDVKELGGTGRVHDWALS
jgi:phosphoribosylanthranilate isomerase